MAWLADQPAGKFLLVSAHRSPCSRSPSGGSSTRSGVIRSRATRRPSASSSPPWVSCTPCSRSPRCPSRSRTGAETPASASGSGGGGGGDETSKEATSKVLDWPAGPWLVALGGIVLIGYALWSIKHHVIDQSFTKRLEKGDGTWVARLGQAGIRRPGPRLHRHRLVLRPGRHHLRPQPGQGAVGRPPGARGQGLGPGCCCGRSRSGCSATACSASPRRSTAKRRSWRSRRELVAMQISALSPCWRRSTTGPGGLSIAWQRSFDRDGSSIRAEGTEESRVRTLSAGQCHRCH